MESGYTRNHSKALSVEERRARERLRRVERSKGPQGQTLSSPPTKLKKRGKSVSTIAKELEAQRGQLKRRGYKFAVEHMDDAIDFLRGAMALKQPWMPDGSLRQGGDVELFFRLIGLLRDFTNARAPYQTPRLSAVAVVPAAKGEDHATTMTVNIFNQRGERVGDDAKVLSLQAVRDEDEDAA